MLPLHSKILAEAISMIVAVKIELCLKELDVGLYLVQDY